MWKSLLRAVGLDRRRSFDAAGGGRRWDGARTVDGLNGSIQAGATMAARRAGWYARNNPWVSAAVQSLAANAVGAGIKPRSRHPDAKVRNTLHSLWDRWTDRADAAGLTVSLERLGTVIGDAEAIDADGKGRVVFEEVDDLIGEQIVVVLRRHGQKVVEERMNFGELWNGT